MLFEFSIYQRLLPFLCAYFATISPIFCLFYGDFITFFCRPCVKDAEKLCCGIHNFNWCKKCQEKCTLAISLACLQQKSREPSSQILYEKSSRLFTFLFAAIKRSVFQPERLPVSASEYGSFCWNRIQRLLYHLSYR